MNSLNKQSIAKNLKSIMARNLISPYELASKAGLTRYQIDNVLYGRALKVESLKKISKALNITIEQLVLSDEEKKLTQPFDIKIYSQIILSIDTMLSFYRLQTNQATIKTMIDLIYEHFKEIKDLDEVVRGMILLLNNKGSTVVNLNDPNLTVSKSKD